MNWSAKIIKHRTYNTDILTFNLGLAIAYRFLLETSHQQGIAIFQKI